MGQGKLDSRQANLSADRLLCLLEYMAEQPHAMRLSDIAAGCGMNISTVHRFLTSLLATGYAVQEEESGLYRLTFGFCRLGDSIRANTELHSLCLPYLHQIAQQTGWTALLVREYDMTALCAEAVPGERAGGALTRRDMAPLQASASGRLLLTGWNARRLEQLAQMRGLRGGGPSTLAALRRELVMVRARGYALDNEETEPGWRGLAVPLRDYTNQPVAALEVRGPVRAWPGDEALEPLEALNRAAAQLCAFLGYDPARDRPPAFRR